MSRRRRPDFGRAGKDPEGQFRRYQLELSERLGMTAWELGKRMSTAELTERRALDMVHADERRAAEKG